MNKVKLILGIVLIIVGLITIKLVKPEVSTENEVQFEKISESNATQFNDINIDVNNASIEIIATDSQQIKVTGTVNDDRLHNFEKTETNNTFTLKEISQDKWIDLFNFKFYFDHSIVVEIPNDYNGDLTLNNTNGNIDIIDKSKFTFNNVNITSNNSYILIENTSITDTVEVETNNGGVNLNDLEVNTITAHTSNGPVILTDLIADEIKAETSNGPILIENLSVNSSLDLETSNGRIEGSINDSKDNYNIISDTSNGSNNVESNNNTTAEKQMVLDTSNGSIDITFDK